MACNLQPDQSDDLLYVKRGNVYCGYSREYLAQNLSKMEEGFVVCKKCSGIMREASLSNGKTSCLVCSATRKKPTPVKDVQKSIEVLGIKCPLLRDCDWKGELSEAETHLKDCLFFVIQCCLCKQILPRSEREEHETNTCPKRIIDCDYCYEDVKAEDKDKHLQVCFEFPIPCPNECGANFTRIDISKHRSECELETVTCPYMEYGCKTEFMFRRDLLAHKKENIIKHTDMSLVKMNCFQSEIQQLKDENASLKKEQDEKRCKGMSMKQLDGVEWDINLDKLEYGEEIEGPAFYVNNYKLRIYCIYRGFWNYFYFYLKRIEGEFDRNLGIAYITHYRVVKVDKQDFNESEYTEGIMNYQLEVGIMSEEIPGSYFRDDELCQRFYFDINSDLLSSLAVEYIEENTCNPADDPEYLPGYGLWEI